MNTYKINLFTWLVLLRYFILMQINFSVLNSLSKLQIFKYSFISSQTCIRYRFRMSSPKHEDVFVQQDETALIVSR